MEGRFKYKLLSKYPHMKPADVEVWEKFIIAHPDFFDTVDYDFRVGEGANFLPTGEKTPDERENWLYQRKIDVVGYKSLNIWIIEIKPIADMFALGQIIVYRDLCIKEKKFPGDFESAVMCSKINKEMKEVFYKQSITIMKT